MKTPSVRSTAIVAVLGTLLSGCGDDDVAVPVTLTVSADLRLDAGSGITGEIVLDLEAPPGDEPRALVLQYVAIESEQLAAVHLDGLDDFPDELAPGERRQVVLHVTRPGQSEHAPPAEGCGRPSSTLHVSATVLDATTAAATDGLGGTVTATGETPLTRDEIAPPVVVRTVWTSSEPVLVASSPDDDVILAVTTTGVARHVAVDGTTDEPADLAIAPSLVARGGGVDVVVGTVAPGDPRCPPDLAPEARILARIVDGGLAWCAPVDPLFNQVMAVGRDGVTWLVEGDDTAGHRVRRIDPDGATLSTTEVESWLLQIVPAPDGRIVAAGYDPRTSTPTLAVLDGERQATAPGDLWMSRLRHRVDGAVAASVHDGWYEVDLDAVALRRVGSFDTGVVVSSAEVVELEGGDLVTVSGHGTDMLELAVHDDAWISWRGALTCGAFTPRALATAGHRRIVAATPSVPTTPVGAVTSLFAIERAP